MLVYFYVVSYSIKVLHTTTDGSLSHVLAVWCWARDYHAAAAATFVSLVQSETCTVQFVLK